MLVQQTDFKYAVEGSNQVPPKSTHNVVPATLTHQSHTNNCPQHLGATDAIDERRSHKVSEDYFYY